MKSSRAQVLVFSEKFNSRSAGQCRFRVIHIPLIESRALQFQKPNKVFDFILVTSKNTAEFVRSWPRAGRVLCVGEETKKRLPKELQKRSSVLSDSHSEGLVRYFQHLPSQSIFFPRSKRADPQTVARLRRRGHRVLVRHVYTTRLRLRRSELEESLLSPSQKIFIVTSPSILRSLAWNLGRKKLRALEARWIALGPSTARAAREYGLRPQIAKKASLDFTLKTL